MMQNKNQAFWMTTIGVASALVIIANQRDQIRCIKGPELL